MKRPWESWVIWLNTLGLGLLFLSPEVKQLICENKNVAAVVLVINLILRFKTDSAIAVRKPDEPRK